MNSSVPGSVASQIWLHPASKGFRSLFYLYTPGESSYENLKDVPDVVGKAVPFFFALIALEMVINYVRWGRKLREPRWNDSFSSLAAGVISVLPLLLVRSIEMSAYIYVYNNYRLMSLPWNSAALWWLTLLGVDMGYYWVHRMAHEINFMWAAHQVHHSSEDYNLTTALRQSVLQRYSSWIFYLPMAFFIPPSTFIVHIQFNLLYQFWIHTDVIRTLPAPLEFILNTPSHHRVHHGRNRYCIDKNYAGVFIIWDRMFGTFTPEDPNDKIAYGLVHPLNSWDPIYTQLCHWKYIVTMVAEEKSWTNKLWRLVKGPGWTPGSPRMGVITDIPDTHGPVKKYNPHISLWQTAYCALHFLLAMVFNQLVTENKSALSSIYVVYAIIFILWTLTNIGYFYENRWYASFLEVLRCGVYLAVDSYFCSNMECPPAMSIVRIIFGGSAVIWAISCIRSINIQKKKVA